MKSQHKSHPNSAPPPLADGTLSWRRFASANHRAKIRIMNRYPDEMLLEDARTLFFKRSNLGEDGGYSSRWVRVKSKPLPFYFPNSRSRVAAARLHDLHHIATEYETTGQAKRKFQRGKLPAAAGIITPRGSSISGDSISASSSRPEDSFVHFSVVATRSPTSTRKVLSSRASMTLR